MLQLFISFWISPTKEGCCYLLLGTPRELHSAAFDSQGHAAVVEPLVAAIGVNLDCAQQGFTPYVRCGRAAPGGRV